ncbi:signal peptide protein [Paenibacillus chungangensis]|uniref:Signal peptide protein n=1 Tax=Paenibacillus chungangensis TaxID=696535 RepID=A0ABW3HRC0_9BACL
MTRRWGLSRKRGRAVWMAGAISLMLVLAGCGSNYPSVFNNSATYTVDSVSSKPANEAVRVPWDYRIVEGTVGDLIGSDMTLLPNNELMPNDGNYATGDKAWILQFMDAELVTGADERNEIRLSAWRTIKSFKDESTAKGDLEQLKVAITTEVDLVGVYKTEYKGETRNFAIVELPSGNRIKQPIDDARYTDFEKKKTVDVHLEEVHDFADYDLAYAKFRGWAN